MITARVFTDGRNVEHNAACVAFFDGLRHLGVDAAFCDVRDGYADCEVAVVFGVFKKAVPASFERGQIIARHRVAGRNVMVIEKGYVCRDAFYAVGWNGLNGRADFRNGDERGLPYDRLGRLQGHGIDFRPSHDGDNIVVFGQVPWDAAVDFSDHRGWCEEALRRAKAMDHDGRGVVFRPHPLVDREVYGPFCKSHMRTTEIPLDVELQRCALAVTFNSNSGVDAVLHGCRVVAVDDGSMVAGIAERAIPLKLSAVPWPRDEQRFAWLRRLAYTQWTLQEMAIGSPYLHLTGKTAP